MAAGNLWESLPSVIIVQILSYLTLNERLKASSVCRRWRCTLFHPHLWRDAILKLNNSEANRTKHFVQLCGQFFRRFVLEFEADSGERLNDACGILSLISENRFMESLILKPSTRMDMLPAFAQVFDRSLQHILCNTTKLRQLSLGYIEQLTQRSPQYLSHLARNTDVECLNLACIVEEGGDYTPTPLPAHLFENFYRLRTLALDYVTVTDDLLRVLQYSGRSQLRSLIITVNENPEGYHIIKNNSWHNLVRVVPHLEVTVTMLPTMYEGSHVADMLRLLRPAMPLAHLRMLMCQEINTTAIEFIAQHSCKTFQTLYIMDSIEAHEPLTYDAPNDEDPFVMLAWKCKKLHSVTILGYAVQSEDIVAMSRLRGPSLTTLQVADCCVVTWDEEQERDYLGMTQDHVDEIADNIGQPDWEPISTESLPHGALLHHEPYDLAYMKMLLQDVEN